MSEYTAQDFADKVDYEGGLGEAIFGYGLDESYLDRETDPELWEAVRALAECKPLYNRVYDLLPEPGEEE